MFDQSSDSKKFRDAAWCQKQGYTLIGNVWWKAAKRCVPLYEAKMLQAFDHRASSVLEASNNMIRTGQKAEASPVQHSNPEFCVLPRWWVSASDVADVMKEREAGHYLCYKRISSSTNERTVIACFVPGVAVAHPSPILLTGASITPRLQACLLSNLNAFVLDFVARQKLGSKDLDYFVMRQLPTLPPDTYADKCPWSKKETLEHWISERVLKLSCTAEDMIPLAKACGFAGSPGDGVHVWKEKERAELRAELDAAYFILYGIDRADVEYMLGTFSGTGFIAGPDRDDDGRAWERGGQGGMILEAYDHLSGLATAR
jgi:hypothetical protein